MEEKIKDKRTRLPLTSATIKYFLTDLKEIVAFFTNQSPYLAYFLCNSTFLFFVTSLVPQLRWQIAKKYFRILLVGHCLFVPTFFPPWSCVSRLFLVGILKHFICPNYKLLHRFGDIARLICAWYTVKLPKPSHGVDIHLTRFYQNKKGELFAIQFWSVEDLWINFMQLLSFSAVRNRYKGQKYSNFQNKHLNLFVPTVDASSLSFPSFEIVYI